MDRPDDEPAIHPLLASRWSPTTFDAADTIDQASVLRLLEAARWAPSAGNSEPWAFVVGVRGTARERRPVDELLWCPDRSP